MCATERAQNAYASSRTASRITCLSENRRNTSSDAVKQQYETPEDGRQRGYTSFGVEHAKDTAAPDLKEFWHVGRTLPADHELVQSGDVPANQFPSELPAFGATMSELFAAQERFANRLLEDLGDVMGVHNYLAQIKSKSSDLQKNLWMDSLKTCPARGDCLGMSQDECVCSCGAYLDDLAGAAEANVTSSLLWTMFLEIVFDGSSFESATLPRTSASSSLVPFFAAHVTR